MSDPHTQSPPSDARDSWDEAWRAGRTGWDAGAPAPALVDLLRDAPGLLPTAADGPRRALVPGCGAGYDAFALARAGFTVTGLDIAPTAAQRFTAQREREGVAASDATIHTGDFFSYTPEAPFDVIWDYTFLCAIPPTRRQDWAESMRRLLRPDGVLLTLIFPIFEPDNPTLSQDGEPGPPYRMHPDGVRALLTEHFTLLALTEVARSHPGRAGKERLARWRPRL